MIFDGNFEVAFVFRVPVAFFLVGVADVEGFFSFFSFLVAIAVPRKAISIPIFFPIERFFFPTDLFLCKLSL